MAIRLMNPSVEMDGENQIGEFRGTVDIDPSLGRSMSPPEWTIAGGVCPRAVPCPHAVHEAFFSTDRGPPGHI
jgi:hypothetical protein